MKNVSLTTHDTEAIIALYDNVNQIQELIDSAHYDGLVVSWRCVTTMHVGLCRKYLKESKDGLDITLATDLINHLAQAYALTDFTLDAYGEKWPYRDSLQAFADRCDRLRAGVHVAIKSACDTAW
jgi:hypothetical protein